MCTQNFDRGSADKWIDVGEMAEGQIGERFCEIRAVDEHFHAVNAQLAVGISGAGG